MILMMLLAVELIFEDETGPVTGDITSGDIVQTLEIGAALAEVEDMDGAGDVDLVGDLWLDGEVIDGGEVPDDLRGGGDAVEGGWIEAEVGIRDVAGEQLDGGFEGGGEGSERVNTGAGEREEMGLNEEDAGSVRGDLCERDEEASGEEAREAGEEGWERGEGVEGGHDELIPGR
jgi:hypothetical protein